MKRTATFFATLLAAALCTGASVAADELGGLEFDTVDADADGFITFLEIRAVAPRASREQFDDFDVNSDEQLDREEYSSWLDAFVGRE
jgi:Ca2+-binding EF-hand superfamily protein